VLSIPASRCHCSPTNSPPEQVSVGRSRTSRQMIRAREAVDGCPASSSPPQQRIGPLFSNGDRIEISAAGRKETAPAQGRAEAAKQEARTFRQVSFTGGFPRDWLTAWPRPVHLGARIPIILVARRHLVSSVMSCHFGPRSVRFSRCGGGRLRRVCLRRCDCCRSEQRGDHESRDSKLGSHGISPDPDQ
jgi:hypothetical protein